MHRTFAVILVTMVMLITTVWAITQPTESSFDCRVTAINDRMPPMAQVLRSTSRLITLVCETPNRVKECRGKSSPECRNTIIDIRADHPNSWPAEWKGEQKVGRIFRAKWEGQLLRPLSSHGRANATQGEPICLIVKGGEPAWVPCGRSLLGMYTEGESNTLIGSQIPNDGPPSRSPAKPERRYAHAQQDKPKAITDASRPTPAGEIKMPERENVLLKGLQAQVEKIREEYKLSEYDKEIKALDDLYRSSLKALEQKYKLEEVSKKLAPVNTQYEAIVKFAIIDAGLTDEQKTSMELFRDEKSGDWSWRPKKIETPPKVN